MPDGVYFSPDNGERIARTVRAVEADGGLILPRPRQLVTRDVVPVPFRNDYAGTVPAYGVCQVAEPVTLDGVQIFPVTRPTTTFKRLYLVNGPDDVADDGYGWGTWLWHADWVLYDDANTPALGESWGPQDGSFELKKYMHGFTIWGNPSGGSTDLVMAQQWWVNGEILVKNDSGSAIAANASGTFKIFTGAAGSEADSGMTITAYNKTSVSFANGKFGAAAWIHGAYYAVPWQT